MVKNEICKDLKFEECELTILRMAVDKAEQKIGRRIVNSTLIQQIIIIVENFIKTKKLICYGGTAINNILPIEDQFYNKDSEIPDYDFFSPNALQDAKELADIYYKEGFTDVEAKAGQHHGTYKIFVNYIPVADITMMQKEIFNSLKKESMTIGGILYTPPNYLRMSMYLELSRPAGDTSRWEKILKRLTLLNKNYPISDLNCHNFNIKTDDKTKEDKIYDNIKSTLIKQGVVFLGSYAVSLYSKYMPFKERYKLDDVSNFDVLSNEPEKTSEIIKERLKDIGINNVQILKKNNIGELIPEYYEIKVGNNIVCHIYKTIACHSYNIIFLSGQKVKIATIDTMLSFYLAFLYAGMPYYNSFLDKILCMAQFLFTIQQKNKLKQKGLLKRFSITCYGHQDTVQELRAKKAEKYKELKKKGNYQELEEWFLNYKPDELKNKTNKNKTNKNKTNKNKTNKNKTNKNKTNKNKSNVFTIQTKINK